MTDIHLTSAPAEAGRTQESPAEETPALPGREPDTEPWEDLRERVLNALEEDPVNEGRLAGDLDRHGAGSRPAQRVLAALTGVLYGDGEARRLLTEAFSARRRWQALREGPAPLRLALLDVLQQENRRRTDPLLTELRVSPPPSRSAVADPVSGCTTSTALLGAVQNELRRARRFKQDAAVLHLHLGHREELAWHLGRAGGERLLGRAVLEVKNLIRDVDWAARTLDHDLLLFLAGTGHLGALQVAQRVIAKLGGLERPPGTPPGELRVSIGLATFPGEARFGPELLEAAARAELQARAAGGGIAAAGVARGPEFLAVPEGRVRVVVRTLDESVPAGTALPGGGVLFKSDYPYAVGSQVELDCLEVSGPGHLTVRGRVIRLEELPGGGFAVGVACRLDAGQRRLLDGAEMPPGP